MSQQRFIQKTALITGGCGGLGRAIAEALLRVGTNVVVCDINEELMSDFKEKVSSAYPECTLVLQADITQDDQVERVFAEGEKMFGGIDYVINSAGRIDRFDAVAEMEKKTWNAVIALNLTAPAVVSGRAIKQWLETGKEGAIVNIASTASFRGFNCGMSPTCVYSGRRSSDMKKCVLISHPTGAAYTASKHGLVGLTKNTGAFYGSKGIRCNAIAAGAMATNISATLAEGCNMDGVARMRQTCKFIRSISNSFLFRFEGPRANCAFLNRS